MPRAPRVVVPGTPVHVIQRGNNRTATFGSAEDFERYRTTLRDASRRFGCAVHAFVLMSNHVHLLITPYDARSVSLLMQMIGRHYVRYINTRYGRTGSLWEGRFRSSPIDSERYLFTCSRYIELNPVRAGMVDAPDRYRWSSHLHNAFGRADDLITPHPLYLELGSTTDERRATYRALFDAPMRAATINAIRRAVNTGGGLGDAEFCERVRADVGRSVTRLPHGGDRRSALFRSSGL